MPVVSLPFRDLEALTGVSARRVLERLPMLGCDVERLARDHADVEFFPDRPDLFSVEGVARAMRGFLGREGGLRRYPVEPSGARIRVERSVRGVRPVIAGAYLRGVQLKGSGIESLIHLQENLHWTLGRNRRRVAIGLHDASKVEPPFVYRGAEPGVRFRPLDGEGEMSLREILEKHSKGREYAFILEGRRRYPLIEDARGNVLSFPPIINGERTRVSGRTRDLFIDVTGLDHHVAVTLNILVASLAERGSRVESVVIEDGGRRRVSPDLSPARRVLRVSEARDLLGLDLTAARCAVLLRRMGYGAAPRGGSVAVEVPAWRADILHSWDLIEDIAKAYGYENLEPRVPPAPGHGRPLAGEERRHLARELLVGLGYSEMVGFTLTSPPVNFRRMRLEPRGETVIANPVSEEQSMVRTHLLGTLLSVLAVNKHRPYPQRLFEVGDVVAGGVQQRRLAAVSAHARARFAEARGLAGALRRDLDLPAAIRAGDHPSFLEGRCGALASGARGLGAFGEIHPEVLENFGIEVPAVAIELALPG
ncbi:MAG: phenylalanine--tRNA ligase subunit beta [Euryarchaeota archaeon]|nr:phenylalanine--tRNA ligase subunit beta [Euryarchaeota archaeon]